MPNCFEIRQCSIKGVINSILMCANATPLTVIVLIVVLRFMCAKWLLRTIIKNSFALLGILLAFINCYRLHCLSAGHKAFQMECYGDRVIIQLVLCGWDSKDCPPTKPLVQGH
jgi:O-antigen ligase